MTFKISVFCAFVILIIGFFVALKIQYFKRFQNRYSIKAMFPFESNYQCKFNDNTASNFMLIASGILAIIFMVIFDTNHTNGFLVFCSAAGIIVSIISVCLFFVGFKSNKLHLTLSVMLFAFVAMMTFGVALGCFQYFQDEGSLVAEICCIAAFTNSIIEIIFMLSKDLTKPITSEQVTNPDGTVSYIRPKKIQMAYTEWVYLICFVVNIAILFIISLVL